MVGTSDSGKRGSAKGGCGKNLGSLANKWGLKEDAGNPPSVLRDLCIGPYGSPKGGLWKVSPPGGDDAELRQWHYIYAYIIRVLLLMREAPHCPNPCDPNQVLYVRYLKDKFRQHLLF